MKSILIFLYGTVIYCASLMAQDEVDIVIVGGGAGGTSAGIQAARMGAKVRIIEATPWLGGMLTSAGVSAIDGNHELPSGIWGEFRQRLRDHYGGAQALATGWVSHTLFEPSVGDSILKVMADIPNLEIVYNAVYSDVLKDGDSDTIRDAAIDARKGSRPNPAQENGLNARGNDDLDATLDGISDTKKNAAGWTVTYQLDGKSHSVKARILIDATETGELLPLVGADFRLGMDAKTDTGEREAPEAANDIVQDLTYVLILEDVSVRADGTRNKKGLVSKPKNYDPEAYSCACKREDGEMFGGVSDCKQMLDYGKLPNNKYMVNWPNCGNDFYVGWPDMTLAQRLEKLEEAKAFTKGFVYYIQNELGFKNLRVAEEFPTKDGFPMIPYDREARRVKGKAFLTVDHLERPYDFGLYRTGVAVGDYPIDHHHDKNPDAPEINFINIKVPSYNVPLGSLVPESVENFIVAEKNISVSNIVNGATRLQPVVLGIGQAAGALAATAVHTDRKPSGISIRKVQDALLESKAYLMPFIDVPPDDQAFASIQRIGATGILKGYGIPYKWANQTWFYPDRVVSEYEWKAGMLPYHPELDKVPASGVGITVRYMEKAVQAIAEAISDYTIMKRWADYGMLHDLDSSQALNRKEVSLITDYVLNPFAREIDFSGNLK